MTITPSLEDYIEAVFRLETEKRPASVSEVARLLAVKKPSVVRAMETLKKRELAVQDPYGPIALTALGRRMARDVYARHILLRTFLHKLGVCEANADADACRMEHVLSAETLECIRRYIRATSR